MADDDFGKIAGKVITTVAAGTAAVALEHITGGDKGAIVALTGAGAGILEWFQGKTGGEDERFAALAWRVGALEDQFVALAERVQRLEAEGVTPDRQDPLSQEGVLSDFAKAVIETRSPAKREALVNAAAHQFDPRLGEPHSRSYWFDRVKALSDIEAAVMNLFVGGGQGIGLTEQQFVITGHRIVQPPAEDWLAMRSAIFKLERQVPDPLVNTGSVQHKQADTGEIVTIPHYTLTLHGQVVVRFIAG